MPEQVIVSVRDNGIGIPTEMLPRIFDMFTQVDRSLDRFSRWLRIGLSLVQRLLELHGGSVRAFSEGEGKGSEFQVTLPTSSEKPRSRYSDADKRSDNADAKKPTIWKILVVDDNRDAASTLVTLLGIAGHQTEVAFDGLEALEKASRNPSRFNLARYRPSKMKGYEVASDSANDWGKEILLIALTGWGKKRTSVGLTKGGFDEHLVKPINLQLLFELLTKR